MDKDTVKLIRVPADTWRAVVEALSPFAAMAPQVDTAGLAHTGKTAALCLAARDALGLARKVSAE